MNLVPVNFREVTFSSTMRIRLWKRGYDRVETSGVAAWEKRIEKIDHPVVLFEQDE